jgi:signal peptidase I
MKSLIGGTSDRQHRVLSGLLTACLAALTVVCIVAAIAVVAFHIEVRPVLTGSMVPTFGPGAILITRPVPVTDLRKGMIVLFVPPGEHAEFAHRITSVGGSTTAPTIGTKGDANKAPDPWHAQLTSPTIPEVIGTVPWVGRLMVGLRGPVYLVMILIGGLVVGVGGTRWILRPRSSHHGLVV